MKAHFFGATSALLLALASSPLGAQTTVVDEGTFVLRENGREVGREVFAIRRSGTGPGAVVIAQGRVDLGEADDLVTSLEVSGEGFRPATYAVQVEGAEPQRIAGRVAGGRFSARIISPAGEMMREYLAGEGAVIVDEGVAHQYYFIAQQLDETSFTVPLIIPRQSRQVSASVSVGAAENLTIGGQSVMARRLDVRPTGLPDRSVWVDAQGRVLRLEIRDRGMTAERLALPGS
jgi:hypothetical protein